MTMPLPEFENRADAQAPLAAHAMTATKAVAYDVVHTLGPVFDCADPTLAQTVAGRPVFIVADAALWPQYGPAIERYAQARLHCVKLVRLAGDEAVKSLVQVAALCDAAFDVHLPRNGAFVAVGGGTILDAVGFAASIYRRGIAYVRVPTTLVGMVDVGVGIKQAINFGSKKNALGSFYPPLRTINDVRFLASLPARQLSCGMAEALKVGLVCDGTLFALLEEHGPALLASGFRAPAGVAIDVVTRAEVAMLYQLTGNLYETELRRLVDFGHSFSPILETASAYAIAHGEAVALDMLLSTGIAAGRGMCDPGLVGRLQRLYERLELPATHPAMSPLLMERALFDARAHRGGAQNLVIPTGIGSGDFLQDVGYDEIARALALITSRAVRPR